MPTPLPKAIMNLTSGASFDEVNPLQNQSVSARKCHQAKPWEKE
jgi:hypothetical protein